MSVRSKLTALSLSIATACATAQAQSFDATVYAQDVRGWQVDALTDRQGFLGCAGTSDQPFGILGVIQSRDGWLLRVPTRQTESFSGVVVKIDGRIIDAQIGFLPEGAGEIVVTDQAIGWLTESDEVTIEVPNDYSGTWGLVGSTAMITKVKECYQRRGKTGSAAAKAPKAKTKLAAPGSSAGPVEWLDDNGRSCGDVCRRAGKEPLQTGTFENGNPFFVCAADSRGRGWRAGFNLEPKWSRACWVGYGGREVAEPNYQCACE